MLKNQSRLQRLCCSTSRTEIYNTGSTQLHIHTYLLICILYSDIPTSPTQWKCLECKNANFIVIFLPDDVGIRLEYKPQLSFTFVPFYSKESIGASWVVRWLYIAVIKLKWLKTLVFYSKILLNVSVSQLTRIKLYLDRTVE